MRISVILPVYNVEPYIGRCIDSLKAQTLDGLEFIFVDDCSTDNSMSVVEEWAAQDERVRILRNEENLGAGLSRNRGIEAARGDYLGFVDSDDYIAANYYQLLYTAAVSDGGHDIAKGIRIRVNNEGDPIYPPDQPLNTDIALRHACGEKLYEVFRYEHTTAIYRRDIMRDTSASNGLSSQAEDTIFLLRYCYLTDDIVLEDNAVYYYVQREGSTTNVDGRERNQGEIDALVESADFFREKGIDDAARRYLITRARGLVYRFQGLLGEGRIGLEDYPATAKRIREILEDIPGAREACENELQLKEIMDGSPLTTPGLRFPGEGETRISVIIPVYNPGPGIRKCIESLKRQLLDGLEFIFVDDCSTDDSMSAVGEWAAQDARVRILRNEENLGAGLSRNRGIEAARGDYLGFVDPDDYISTNYYQLLYAAAIADGGHDIAKGVRQKEGPETGWGSRNLNPKIRAGIASGIPLYTMFTYEHQTGIYKRRLFEAGARNGTSRKAQDTTFLLSVGLLTDDIVFEANAKYYYLRREGSAVNTNSYQRYIYDLDSLAEKAELLDQVEHDSYVRGYLKMMAESYLTSYHSGLLSNPELASKLEDYRTYLSGVIDKHPSLEFLSDESAVARALLTHGVSLARVGSLPFDQVIEGAQIWIDFTHDHLDETGYLNECAFNMAAAIQKLTGAQGVSGFKSALSRLAQRASRLPVRQRTLLWAKTLRRLATRINARKAYERIKNKLGRK